MEYVTWNICGIGIMKCTWNMKHGTWKVYWNMWIFDVFVMWNLKYIWHVEHETYMEYGTYESADGHEFISHKFDTLFCLSLSNLYHIPHAFHITYCMYISYPFPIHFTYISYHLMHIHFMSRIRDCTYISYNNVTPYLMWQCTYHHTSHVCVSISAIIYIYVYIYICV